MVCSQPLHWLEAGGRDGFLCIAGLECLWDILVHIDATGCQLLINLVLCLLYRLTRHWPNAVVPAKLANPHSAAQLSAWRFMSLCASGAPVQAQWGVDAVVYALLNICHACHLQVSFWGSSCSVPQWLWDQLPLCRCLAIWFYANALPHPPADEPAVLQIPPQGFLFLTPWTSEQGPLAGHHPFPCQDR